jgi:hypothetical protein
MDSVILSHNEWAVSALKISIQDLQKLPANLVRWGEFVPEEERPRVMAAFRSSGTSGAIRMMLRIGETLLAADPNSTAGRMLCHHSSSYLLGHPTVVR